MTDTIEVFIDLSGATHLVGRCRYVTKRHKQGSVFGYADEWLDYQDAFALDPANLPLDDEQIYTTSEEISASQEHCEIQHLIFGESS